MSTFLIEKINIFLTFLSHVRCEVSGKSIELQSSLSTY